MPYLMTHILSLSFKAHIVPPKEIHMKPNDTANRYLVWRSPWLPEDHITAPVSILYKNQQIACVVTVLGRGSKDRRKQP